MNPLELAVEEMVRLQRELSGLCVEKRYTEAVAVGRELLQLTLGFGDPYEGASASDAAWALRYLGDAFAGAGDATAAEQAYREAAAITTAVFGLENHQDTLPSLAKLGRFLHAKGSLRAAIPHLSAAVNIYEMYGASEHAEAVALRGLLDECWADDRREP